MHRPFLIFIISFLSLINQDILAFSDEPVIWSGKRLSWSDFLGTPPGNPAGNSVAQASTAISLDPVEYYGDKVLVEIKALFNREQSWVLPGNTKPHILNHEQRHFDITEYCVRRIRKELKNIGNYEEVFHRISADCQKMQVQYDHDTGHGTNREKQNHWDRKIDRMLRSLDRYSGSRVMLNR